MHKNLSSKCTKHVDISKRRFIFSALKIISAIGALFVAFPFISSLSPNRKVLEANKPVKIDLSHLKPGEQITIRWRGKPVWIIYRTPQQLAELTEYNANLRDPDSLTAQQPDYAKNVYRSRDARYLVLVGLCTHLGCSPKFISANIISVPSRKDSEYAEKFPGKNTSGFYCPCHGSCFDLSGRVYKNMPAPINLEVPPYYFLNENTIVIGESHG